MPGRPDLDTLLPLVGCIDFKDAYHRLQLRHDERGYATFRTHDGWAVYKSVPFGLASAPLVWARHAAFLC
eukprot:5200990-Amphidinium_carterae.1